MMHSVNGTIERQFQTALAGRHARTALLDRKLPTVAERAAADAAKGLRGTNAQVALGRMVDEAYGKYSKFDPSTRRIIGSVTPFLAWTRNSIRFVTHTLPVNHPIVTALLAAEQHATIEWQRAHGLYEGPGGVSGFLQGSIPDKGGWIRASRYTPFGLFQDPAGAISSLVFPQYEGALRALEGEDWKGDPLEGVDTSEEKFAAALKAFAEGTIPLYSQWAQFRDKKGSTAERLCGQFDPLFPVKRVEKRSSAGSSSRDQSLRDLQQMRGSGQSREDSLRELQRLRGG
jgi:hypothetical protein